MRLFTQTFPDPSLMGLVRVGLVFGMACAGTAWSSPLPPPRRDLTKLSLDELAGMTVTSVSKKPDDRSKTPAAIFVITQEDMRRSGATTLAEALRLAPGVSVARIDSDHWSVGIRGFGDQFSKSLLVLIDGRSVYTPLFAGVYWGVQDTLLEDVERIEVIRGPGGTIWGANAVNGVINIITKGASDTQGLFGRLGGGTVDQAMGAVRYGGGNGRGFDYRAYGKGFRRGPQFHTDGKNFDDWHAFQAGGRADWAIGTKTKLTLLGDAYDGRQGQRVSLASFAPPGQTTIDRSVDVSGANVIARLARTLGPHSDLQVQTYYDRTVVQGPQLGETRNTVDIDVLHHVVLAGRHDLVWGAGARTSPSTVTPTVATLDFIPRRENNRVYSLFVQDEFEALPDKLALTLGAKLEHNNYTGLEVLPSGRLSWTFRPKQVLWAAVTRAVRTPSRLERSLRLNGFLATAPPTFVQIDGNPAFSAERLLAYEVGYRALVSSSVYLDLSGFRNEYDNLASFGAGSFTLDATPPPTHVTLHFPYVNGIKGTTHGFELSPAWRPASRWQLKASYAYLQMSLENKTGNTDTGAVTTYEGSTPRHQGSVQSLLTLPKGLEFDQTVRYVSRLPARGVDSYTSLDLRLGWRFGPGLELAAVGQNLLQAKHAEFGHDPPPIVSIRRSLYAEVIWRR